MNKKKRFTITFIALCIVTVLIAALITVACSKYAPPQNTTENSGNSNVEENDENDNTGGDDDDNEGNNDPGGDDSKNVDFSELTYVAIGDSITAGTDPTRENCVPMDYPYPELVKEQLGLKNCINYGANGTYLTDYKGNGTAISIRYKDMEDAQIVSVLGGINDFCEGDGKQTSIELGNIDDTDNKTIYGALNVLAKGLKEKYPHSFIFFMTPMEVTQSHYPPTVSYTLPDLVQAIKDVAQKYDLPVLDLYNEYPNQYKKRDYFSDGIHPTQYFVREYLAPLIADFIKENYVPQQPSE